MRRKKTIKERRQRQSDEPINSQLNASPIDETFSTRAGFHLLLLPIIICETCIEILPYKQQTNEYLVIYY
jgi:hypothetical protein